MIKYHERRFYKHIVMAAVISLVIAIASTVYGFITTFQDKTMGNSIFEIIYMAVHIIICIFLIVLAVEAITKKPFILRSVCFTNELEPSPFYRFLGIFLTVLGLALITFSTLHFLNVITIFSSFPIFLRLDGINVGINILIIGLSLVLFPISYRKDYMAEMIKKHKGEQL